MEIKEAIKSMNNIVEYWTYKPTEVEAAKIAIEALEKQIPKEVIQYGKESKIARYACSHCGRMYWEKEHIGNYCDGCGQALKYD